MDWSDFVNIVCDTEAEEVPRMWLGPQDLAEDANIARHGAVRHRPIDPFRFLKKDR